MDKQEYRLYLAMLKARGELARKAMADNARRRATHNQDVIHKFGG
ncbi:hypothetical protein [Serratia ureilytica]|nr:hypothetical protein [Serratia ureilytica]